MRTGAPATAGNVIARHLPLARNVPSGSAVHVSASGPGQWRRLTVVWLAGSALAHQPGSPDLISAGGSTQPCAGVPTQGRNRWVEALGRSVGAVGTLTSGLVRQGVPLAAAHHIGSLPPVSSLFAAVLGVNPVRHLLSASGVLAASPAQNRHVLTGSRFFPALISGPFHQGLLVVFVVSAALALIAGVASLPRGGRYIHPETVPQTDARVRSGRVRI